MKKFLMMLLSTMTVLATSLGLIACGETLQVEFVVDGAIYKTVELNDEFAKPADPVKTGYTFLGWFEEGSNAEFDFSKEIDANVKVSARWQVNQYSITFDADGGSAVSAIEEDFGTAVSAPTAPTKTGYTFLGWFEEGATEAYDFDTIEARNVSLKAKWAIAQYTITFNTDGGTAVAPITKDYNSAVVAPTAPTKVGYTFAGWDVAIPSVMPAENITITALWTVNSYSISFDADGGSSVNAINQNYGTAVSAPAAPTKLGYNFVGWFKDGSNVAYDFDTIEARNVSLKAKWDIAQFTITFNTDGGSAVAPITKDYNSAVVAPTAPTKEGHTFAGWKLNGSDYTFTTIPAENIELVAAWTVNSYSISFDANGGSAVNTITQNYGTPVSAPAVPTKDCYTFIGWFEDGSDVAYVFDTIEARNVELTAKWDATTYSILVDVNGGEVENFAKIDYTVEDEPVSITAVPTKDHSTFIGWFGVKVLGGTTYYVGADYLAGSGSPETDLSDASLDEANSIKGFDPEVFARNPFYHDVKLIAKWQGNPYTITYDVKGGNALDSATQTVRYDEEFTLAVPTHDNYDFAGWYIDGTDMLFEDGIFTYTRDVSLYAKWEKIVETTYALYKFNADYSGRVANADEVVLDGLDNISRTTLDEKITELGAKAGDVVEIEIENSEAYVVAKVKLVTGIISTAQELSRMINLSVDEKPSGNWTQWDGYYVLANNIDMTGMAISKNTLPESNSATSYPSYGFAGTIDGAGYTISNLSDMMFYQLGNWSATIKNLSFINLTAPIANGLACLTIDNCYFHIVRDSQYKFGSHLYDHIIGGTHGDADYARTFNMTNTVVKVENNTADKLYLVNNFKSNSIVKFENVILVADSEKVGITTTALDASITDNVTIIGLNETYSGDVSGFDSSIWNTAGNHPTFKGFEVVDATNVGFAYGRHTTVDGVRVENTAPFVGKVAPGVTVTWEDAKDVLLEKNTQGSYLRFGAYKTMLKGSDGKHYLVKINIVHVAINTAEDLKNMMISAAGVDHPNPCVGQVIMLNGDIDMAGITGISYSKNPGYTETAWGFAGTFDGNGYTISNLEESLITLMNASGTIKNVTFKNVKAGKAVVGLNGGGTLNNVKFDIDAFGATEIIVYARDAGARKATTLTDCEIVIRNASSTTNIYFEKGLYSNGSLSINNVKVTTNDGNFYWAGSNATTDLNRTGAVNETFTGTVTPPPAEA